jgi:hypothetical protein
LPKVALLAGRPRIGDFGANWEKTGTGERASEERFPEGNEVFAKIFGGMTRFVIGGLIERLA